MTDKGAGDSKGGEAISVPETGRSLLHYLFVGSMSLVVISAVSEIWTDGAVKPAHAGRIAIWGLLAYFTYTGSVVARACCSAS